jgi:hypothetical protein
MSVRVCYTDNHGIADRHPPFSLSNVADCLFKLAQLGVAAHTVMNLGGDLSGLYQSMLGCVLGKASGNRKMETN